MKKTILLTLIIALAVLLCSCNLDAQDGIYSAIATSTKESSTKVKAYLGYYDSCYYLLTDTSITRVGTGAISFTNISSSENIITEAALLSDGTILVHRHTGSTIEKYSSDGKSVELLKEGLVASRLLSNGVIYGTYTDSSTKESQTGLFASDGTLIEEIADVRTVLESGDYTLVETTSGQIKIYNKTSLVSTSSCTSDLKSSVTLGFEAIDDSTFYILKSDAKVYAISGSTFDTTAFVSISYTLASGKAYSFHYTDANGVSYVVFKASENFVVINRSDKTLTTVSSGYGSIRQNEVVNIKAAEEAGKFIVATYSNYVWKINPTDTTEDPVNILN